MRSGTAARDFASACPPAKHLKHEGANGVRRRRLDLAIALFIAALALFFLVFFYNQQGQEDRRLPANVTHFWIDQFGVSASEGWARWLGRILHHGWGAPLICFAILVPTGLWNLRTAWRAQVWRARFKQPTSEIYQLMQWVRAFEFVAWFVAYAATVPMLGYLVTTLLLSTALSWRLGYRRLRWCGIFLASSFAILLLFRSGL